MYPRVVSGLYVHFPFCETRCRYCDFSSTAGEQRRLPAYADALAREVRAVGAAGSQPEADTVFFGGGTPTLASPEQIGGLMRAIRESFLLADSAEVTIEANPGTVTADVLRRLADCGINRLSVGMQSAQEEELKMLGRIHSFAQVEQTVRNARDAGIGNLSVDVMFGLPGQRLESWRSTLDAVINLQPEHLSAYALSLERGTDLSRAVRSGKLAVPDEETAADMYEYAISKLQSTGYFQYEISNWAKDSEPAMSYRSPAGGVFPQYACRHNLRYWQNGSYLGFGAGAHGSTMKKRYANVRSVEKYLERMRNARRRCFPLSAAVVSSRILEKEEEMRETMWLGLRLTGAGVNRHRFLERFSVDYMDVFQAEIDAALTEGLLEWADQEEALRLTRRGCLLGNLVFSRFVKG